MGGAGIRLRFAEGATFWVSAALDEIWLAFDPPLTAVDAAHFLLEPVLAFVLRGRGILVLHASAVEWCGRGVAFCGPAGTGKSTAAAACVADGAALISDDVVAVTRGGLHGEEWVAHRGTGAIRLWDDAARLVVADLDAAPPFSATWDKRVIGAAALGARHAGPSTPLSMVCLLSRQRGTAGEVRIESIDGHAALRALIPHTVAKALLDTASKGRELLQLGALASDVPLVQLIGSAGAPSLGAIASMVRERIGA